MKKEHTARRTLVKSAPELWAECSVAASLTRHLGQFGEIKITRLEPETAIAWEGERASGMVRLEPSGWGTQVTLTARATEGEAVSAPEPIADEVLEEDQQQDEVVEEPELEAVEPEPEPDPGPRAVEPEPFAVQTPAKGLFARLRGLLGGRPAPVILASESPFSIALRGIEPPPGVEQPTAVEPEVVPEPEPGTADEHEVAPEPEPVDVKQEAPEPDPADPETVLIAALDSLGQAHHRPFSRA